MRVTINDNELNVEVLGPEGAPVLIAHHGGGGIGSLVEPKSTFGPLSARMRVIVFDARGCGDSEGKPPFSHAQWAADMDGLRQWIGADQVIVAGGSYGGFIAMEYAIAYPDRGGGDRRADPEFQAGGLRAVRALAPVRGGRAVPVGHARFRRRGAGLVQGLARSLVSSIG